MKCYSYQTAHRIFFWPGDSTDTPRVAPKQVWESQVLEAKMFLTCEMKHASNYDDDEYDGNNDHNDRSMPVMET